jgi:voltage-gated potassium channel
MNPDINIISTVVNEEMNKSKFLQVGANKVVSPYSLSSTRIVRSVLNPAIEDLHEITSGSTHVELQVSEIIIGGNSTLIGKSIIQSRIREYGVIVIGVKRTDGSLIFLQILKYSSMKEIY